MADTPVVSIIICTRNRADRLGETINSVMRLDTRHSWEALLVDNASSDATREVIGQFCQADQRLAYHRCDQVGLGAAREFARTRARGQILAFTDDDCLIAPDYVDRIVEAFAQHGGAGVIGGRIEQVNPAHLALTIDERTEVVRTPAKSFVPTGAFHGANLSFLAPALDRAGGFDPRLGAGTEFPCEDIDAVARVVAAGFDAVFDPRVIVRHDHGRVEADRPAIMAAYDRGRGAYFARLIANKATRTACRSAWLGQASRTEYRANIRPLWDEATFALRYAGRHLGLSGRAKVLGVAADVLMTGHWSWIANAAGRRVGLGRRRART